MPELPSICPACAAPLSAARCAACGAAAVAGPYRIERIIAQSGHGRTYEARGDDGAAVALKELVFALVPTREQLDAFEREAAVLRSLDHPAIPRFVSSFRDGEGPQLRLYLAQELVSGASLLERLERSRFDEAAAKDVARQVLPVLAHLHAAGIVHRDVKPANLIARPNGTLALVDFGAARAVAGVTHGATLVGTFGYMPPEQLGGTVDATSDLYALGATLVHLVGGRSPAELVGQRMEIGLGHLEVSTAFLAYVARLVAPERASRFPSAAAALAAIDAPPAPARSPTPLPRWLVPVAAVLVLLMAVALDRLPDLAYPGPLTNHDPVARAIEANRQLEASMHEPPPPPPPPPPLTDEKKRSLGIPVGGRKLAQVDPDLPACYADAGIDIARISWRPGQDGYLVVGWAHYTGEKECDPIWLELGAVAADGTRLPHRQRMIERPQHGWRDVSDTFDLRAPTDHVRLEIGTRSGPAEAWKLGLGEGSARLVGFAVPAAIEIPATGSCAGLRLARVWSEQDGERRALRVTTAQDGGDPSRCDVSVRAIGPKGERIEATAARSQDGRIFELPVPTARVHLQIAAGREPTVELRVDLDKRTIERAAVALR